MSRTVYLNQFDLGVVNDSRNPTEGACRIVTNFDALTNSYKLTPYYDSETGDTAPATSKKQAFCIGLWGATGTYRLFSLGVVSGTGRAEVLMKGLTSSGNDLSDSGWLTPANNQSSAGTTAFDLFVFYQRTGFIYGARAGTQIWTFDPIASAAWVDSHQALTYTSIGQGIVHSKDDILYIPYYYNGGGTPASIVSGIAKNNAGSWNNTALSMPAFLQPNVACEKGNFLAIGLQNISGVGSSRVFLWDRDSTFLTISDSIDIGDGNVKAMEDLNGELVSISLAGGDTTRTKDRVYFRVVTSTGYQDIAVLEGTTSSVIPVRRQKINNRLYFLMSITLNGAVREGLWSIGRNHAGRWTIVHERTPYNDTALGTGSVQNFIVVGDFSFISSIDASGNYQLSKTNDAASYTATSIRETTVNPGMLSADKPELKKLISVGANYDSLPTAGQAVVKYRVNGASSWTTIFTETADGVVYTEPFTKAASAHFTNPFKDIEFRIESTGGAVFAGLTYKYEVVTSNV